MSLLKNSFPRPAKSHLLLLVISTKLQYLNKAQQLEIAWFKNLR
jgi:hypothetical protein